MITGRQICAARGMLGWDATDLATHAKLTRETISNIENDTVQVRKSSLKNIIRAFDENGVEFTEDGGVRPKRMDIEVLKGVDGFKKFMDNVYEFANHTLSEGKDYEPVCSSSINDKDFIKHLGDYFTFHINRMNALKNFKHRILLKEKPKSLQPEEMRDGGYREYRMRSPQDTANVPFYVYGNKLAVLMLTGEEPQIVVIPSALVAQAYRELFNALWEMAKPFE